MKSLNLGAGIVCAMIGVDAFLGHQSYWTGAMMLSLSLINIKFYFAQ